MSAPPDPEFAAAYREMIERERDRAVHELTTLAAERPDDAVVWELLAVAHHRRLDLPACLAAAERLLALSPDHVDGLLYLGFARMGLGHDADALAAYRRAYELSGLLLAATTAAALMHRTGRFDEAAESYDRMTLSLPADSMDMVLVLAGLVRLLRDRGQPLAADRYAHQLLQRWRVAPRSVSSYLATMGAGLAYGEWLNLVDKAGLAATLRRLLAADPGGRVPDTFVLPADRAALLAYAAAAPPGALYIVKPSHGSGGQGISLTDDPATVADRAGVVVQRYVERPYLIDGRKGHLRIYALITAISPLRAYVYSEGIVRFAPEPYDPRPERLGEIAMHVTNTALHLGHPDLVIADDRDDAGVIWSLSAVLRRMAADGLDSAAVFEEIRALVGWFLRGLERDGFFARQAAAGPARAFPPKLIGFDVVLDAEGHPWLIEIQTAPAPRGAAVVERVNGELFSNAFRMMYGVLARDDLAPADLEALRADPAALARAEAAAERAAMGRFRPI